MTHTQRTPAKKDQLAGRTIYAYDTDTMDDPDEGNLYCPECIESKHGWKIKDRKALVTLYQIYLSSDRYAFPSTDDNFLFSTSKLPQPLYEENIGGNLQTLPDGAIKCDTCDKWIGA